MSEQIDEQLFQFFAGYFHEDWKIDANTPDEVVDNYIAEHSSLEVQLLAGRLESWITRVGDNDIERRMFKELGCYYSPSSAGTNASDWLRHVSKRLRDSSGR